ncbi:MAG: 2-(1,2-epoxy-1,2-dihydrophenyl)acetyl-CoA isomerase [Janthinobacterium sp.]|jgi:2-(1,2-epoxy-1,2-dihydrophenyl)acetyl-CoA isomerase
MAHAEMEAVSYTVSEGVATLTLNRPAQKNALDMVMRREIGAVVASIRCDRGIRALILAGAGGAFCAGGDLRTMMDGGGTAEEARNRMADLHLWLAELLNLDRPVIAVVDGPAYGAGFGLALAADFILATPRARFCLSFLKLGLVPDCAVLYTLPRVVGLQRAKEMAFSTREIDADEALRMGIVFEMHAPERIDARALQLALSFAQASQTALGLTKRALNASLDSSLATMLELEASGQALARSTDFHRDALLRFVKKQPQRFQWPQATDMTDVSE